jgi:uncharacterized membrane protein YgcG
MKCPRCQTETTEYIAVCPQCDFSLALLEPHMSAPAPQAGPINDWAGILTAEETLRLAQRCQEVLARTQVELIVAIIPTTAPLSPAEYVFWLANRWDMGGPNNRGLLLLLALQEHRIESEVGYALEPWLSDAESYRILQSHVVPFLQKGQYAAGLYQAVDVLGKFFEAIHKTTTRQGWKKYFA